MNTRVLRAATSCLAILIAVSSAVGTVEGNSELIVNNESFNTIDLGDGTSSRELRFGSSALTMLYNVSQTRFELSRSLQVGGTLTATGSVIAKATVSGTTLRVSGNADVQGALAASGAVRFDGNLTLNDDLTAADVTLTFGNNISSGILTYGSAYKEFSFDHGIRVAGTISGSGGLVFEGAASGSSLYLGTSLQGAGLTSCSNTTNDKVLWNSATGRFSCGTDQTGVGGSTFGSGNVITIGNTRYVSKQGDTMTGALNIQNGNAATPTATRLLNTRGTMSGRSLTISGTGAAPLVNTKIEYGSLGVGVTTPQRRLDVKSLSGTSLPEGGLSVNNMLFSQLEGGAYMGRTAVHENHWSIENIGSSSTTVSGVSPGSPLGYAMSSDGKYQFLTDSGAGGYYRSTDYGRTWTNGGAPLDYRGVAMSADGKIQVLLLNGNVMSISRNYGSTFTNTNPSDSWRNVAVSADGKYMTATASGSNVYTSMDYGNTWTVRGSTGGWFGIAMSSDGKIQTATMYGGNIYVSSDYGLTWTTKNSSRLWKGVSMSADGKIQTAVVNGGQIYVSKDFGNTWTASATSKAWEAVALSADGRIQFAAPYGDFNYISTDYGVTWARTGIGADDAFTSVAMNSDGKIIGAAFEGGLYLSYSTSKVEGGAAVIGTLSASGSIRTDGDLTLNDDLTSADVTLTFGNSISSGIITYGNSYREFSFDHGIRVAGTISGSGGLVFEGAASGSSLYLGTSLKGAGLTTCSNGTTDKVLWNSTTGRFSCGTDQTGGGGGFGSGNVITIGNTRYVSKQGDTMTGALNIQNGNTHAATTTPLLNTRGTMSGRNLYISGTGASTAPLIFGDITKGYLGIGKNTAKAQLDVVGTVSGSLVRASTQLFSSGSLAVEGNSFLDDSVYIDAASNRTAIGAGRQGITPKTTLEVGGTVSGSLLTQNGAGNNYLMGNVGIGKTTPATNTKLDVVGTVSGSALRVSGNTEVHGTLSASGAIRFDSNLTLNDDLGSNDVTLTFGNSISSGILTYGNAYREFSFDKGIRVAGTISGSGGLVFEGAASGSSLYLGTSLQGAGLTTCSNGTTDKLLWNSSTGRFSCGTDQGGGGGMSYSTAEGIFVNQGGDTMTGALNIQNGTTHTPTSTAILNARGTMSGRNLYITGTGAAAEPLIFGDITRHRVAIGKNFAKADFEVAGTTSGNVIRATDSLASSGILVVRPAGLARPTLFANGTQKVGVNTGTPHSGLTASGSFATAIRVVTATGSINASDQIIFASGASMITLTLPTAVGINGRQYTVKKMNGSTGNYSRPVVIATTGGETIDRLSRWRLTQRNQRVTLISDGANWQVMDATTYGLNGGYTSMGKTMNQWYTSPSNATALANATFTATATIRVMPLLVQKVMDVDAISINIRTTAASSEVRLGIYSDSGMNYPDTLIVDAGTVTTTTTGQRSICAAGCTTTGNANLPVRLQPGLYWMAVNNNSIAMTAWGFAVGGVNPVNGYPNTTTVRQMGWTIANSYAAFPTGFPAAASAMTAVPAPYIGVRIQE